jgi:hypothetical protein
MQAWQYYFQMGQDPAIGFGQVHQESRFDHVDRFCGAQGRSPAACAENRQYPRLILDQWVPMYKNWLAG